MLLSAYLTSVTQLLQDPAATNLLFSTSDLTSYINQAREYIAADAECTRVNGELALAVGQGYFSFSSIVFPARGYAVPLNLRFMLLTDPISKTVYLCYPRPFPWFAQFNLTANGAAPGIPKEWAQQGQGSQGTGYLFPIPVVALTATIDTLSLPAYLVSDTDTDTIPAPFDLAVPFYAAYLAYLSAQRSQEAQTMYALYGQYRDFARNSSNGYTLPFQGAQPRDPASLARYGQQKGGA